MPNIVKKLILSSMVFFATGWAIGSTYELFGAIITLSLVLSFVLGFVVCYTLEYILNKQ